MFSFLTLTGIKYWFHGTDHDSAMHIAINGIDLDRGRAGKDFSDGRGFYLGSDFQLALEWPNKLAKRNTAAIVVFELGGPVKLS